MQLQIIFKQHYNNPNTTTTNPQQQQLIECILMHPSFNKISNAFAYIQGRDGGRIDNAAIDLINLRILQIIREEEKNAQYLSKVIAGIEKYEQIIAKIHQTQDIFNAQMEWYQSEIDKLSSNIPQIQEETELLAYQNSKINPQPDITQLTGDQQLRDILHKYRCQEKGFPKNKTQALMLINRVEGMIQKREIAKLTQ